MTILWVLGAGAALSQALDCARSSGDFAEVKRVELESGDNFHYRLPAGLTEADPTTLRVFAALDEAHLNLRRLGFLRQLAERGLPLANLVSPGASVSPSARLGGNVYVGPGAVVSSGCKVGLGSWLDAGCVVGPDSEIGKGCTIKARGMMGANCRLGLGGVLGTGARLEDGCHAGRHCEFLLERAFAGEIPERSLFHPLFADGARIYNLRAD